jgi:hypothetical protein
MGQEDAFHITFSEEGNLGVVFSDEFLSASVEGQTELLKVLLREKMFSPRESEGDGVSRADAEHEITIILLETFLSKLRSGEHIDKDTEISLNFDELEKPINSWD